MHWADRLLLRLKKTAWAWVCFPHFYWVTALIVTSIVLSCHILMKTNRKAEDVVALISAIVPILAAIVGTLNIVAKHVFPEDEEKHITEVVKTILENDLLTLQ